MPMSPRLLRPRAAGGFDPRAISGLAVWYDAADSASVTLNSGNVAEWRDKSGNGRHMAQSTAARQPAYVQSGQNGRNIIRATANDGDHMRRESGGSPVTENMSYLGASAHTVFIAWKPTSGTAGNYLYWANNNAAFAARMQLTGPTSSTGNYVIDSGSVSGHRLNTTDASGISSAAHLIAFRRDGASAAAWVDGTARGTATFTNTEFIDFSGQFSIFTAINSSGGHIDGASPPSSHVDGDLYEVIHYNRALSTEERQRIQQYIGAKWGITVA